MPAPSVPAPAATTDEAEARPPSWAQSTACLVTADLRDRRLLNDVDAEIEAEIESAIAGIIAKCAPAVDAAALAAAEERERERIAQHFEALAAQPHMANAALLRDAARIIRALSARAPGSAARPSPETPHD